MIDERELKRIKRRDWRERHLEQDREYRRNWMREYRKKKIDGMDERYRKLYELARRVNNETD